ncbi:MAG: hypothetical protein KA242_06220 [Chitinophagales bacterium]|nr:hypothetical protein [Chitinophagales bacterium]
MQLPEAFLAAIQKNLPNDWEQLLHSFSTDSPISIRKHPLKTIDDSYLEPIASTPWCANGRYLKQRPSFTYDPIFQAGAYYVQEASSMFLEQFANAFLSHIPEPVVLDLCAAPGGKSTHLLSMMVGRGVLIANEIIANRNAALRQNIAKWGAFNGVVTQNDPKDFQRLEGLFDLIVVDAPCSGEGMFRKDKNAIAEWNENNVETCIYRQEEILTAILPALKPGGLLIYSTCTFEPGENIHRIEWLTREYALQCIKPSQTFEENGVTTITSGEAVGYAFYPHKTNGEGFFIAALQKPLSDSDSKKMKLSATEKVLADIQQWITQTEANTIITYQEEYHLVSKKYAALKDVFRKTLRIKQEGTIVCTQKGKDLIPAPELAFSTSIADGVRRIEVSYEDAIRILKCENIHFPGYQRGWHLITYKNLGLAWVKVMDNRTNNYYPNNWRILK